jgi:mitogen-activated protein kinase kinase kinase
MSSPEEGISPVVEGGSGFRARTGSFNTSAKRLLQVTTDNEQFTLVDITGMNTAEAIRDRIFSKVRFSLRLVGSGTDEQLRFRDDEYSNLSLQQTEYGEDPDPNTLSHDQLCQLCLSRGDSKASLKFLVIQGVPSSSAAVVPPADISRERPIVSPIRTDLPKQHSHSGSIGSESDVEARRISQFRKSQASSTRSPHTSSISSSSFIPTPPPPHVELPDHTPVPSFTPAPAYASSSAGPSRPSASGSAGDSGWGLGLDTQDEMDPETAALIAQLQLEDQEERQREDERRRQLQADEELARKEQQSEAQEWQAHQHEQEQRVRQQREQIIRDESRAVSHTLCGIHLGDENSTDQ